ncbi:prolyl oligopeptidase family serine peptidase [Draconibacterium sp. IB214405]|uniref:alpha/beta hydrolase family protein n=1 Tax=Draconibacterium sp. IB214405 TaxID=3097352 RepID=UPI002A16C84E|nr:prolyl oligopeptidase family serine peptidase [Draconibacterium sp. IB214405]MDX8340492.1 prolyl oligopeptidase family serine peptidase [Draconibacterium sp. IB214405]
MNKKLIQFLFYISLFAVVFVSCDEMDDVETPVTGNEYLVEAELQFSIPKTIIDFTIAAASIEYPELSEISDLIQSGVDVYKITYKTTFNDNSVIASGMVALPDVAGEYPVLSYQNGTNTEHSKAPSVDSDNQLFQILEMMGSTGFIISLPDYLGFGEADDMFHPYLHRESTVQTVTDMLKAVREFIDDEDEISLNNDLYLAGYSQGGWATMQVQQAIEADAGFEYDLQASACSAGPYNLVTLNEYVVGLEEYPQPYFLAYIFNSYLQLGLTTSIETVFNEPYAAKIPTMFDGITSGSDLNAELTTTITDLFTPEYLAGWNTETAYMDVLDMLDDNSVPAFLPTVPTKLFYGTADTYVPPIVSEEKYDEFIAAGASTSLVQKVPLEGLDHTGGILPAGLASILWFIALENVTM